jgi:hypothetical protein
MERGNTMKKYILPVIALMAMPTLSYSKANIDIAQLNAELVKILASAVKTHQFNDASGKPVLDTLTLVVDEAKTDLSKDALSFETTVGFKTTVWSPGKPSTLSLDIDVHSEIDPATNNPVAKASAELKAKSISAFDLLKYAANQIDKTAQPCTEAEIQRAADPRELVFNRAVCVPFGELLTPKDFPQILSSLEEIFRLRKKYITERLPEVILEGDSDREEKLKEEEKLVDIALSGFAGKTANGVKFSTPSGINVSEETKITSVEVTINTDQVGVKLDVSSGEAVFFLSAYKPTVVEFGETLLLMDSDPAKVELIEKINGWFEDAVDATKELFLQP